jgi:hypothetical protein
MEWGNAARAAAVGPFDLVYCTTGAFGRKGRASAPSLIWLPHALELPRFLPRTAFHVIMWLNEGVYCQPCASSPYPRLTAYLLPKQKKVAGLAYMAEGEIRDLLSLLRVLS